MPAREPKRAPAWDPIFTVTLLVLGLINVTQAVAQARELPSILQQVYEVQGIGRYSNLAAASGAGIGVQLTSVLCLVLAIGFAVPRIRRHRTAFWIPIACAVISLLVSGALVIGVMVTDPAFSAYVSRNN